MRYFHRTSLELDQVMAEAGRFFAGSWTAGQAQSRGHVFVGPLGTVRVTARAEGGHYTLVTLETDQVGESEADKAARRFLATLHARAEPDHVLRGAY